MALVTLLAGSLAPAGADELAGKAQVLDGRTILVAGQRVRLFGIDAPDLEQVCTRAGREYPCGKVARAALWDLVAGMEVACQPTDGESATPAADDAVVADCEAGGFSLGRNMVYTGWALADQKDGADYADVERESKKAGRGLWSGSFDPPWEWRQQAK